VTRNAVETGFEEFLDDVIAATLDEFSVSRALRSGAAGPGGALVDKLATNAGVVHRRVVEPEMETYRRKTIDQFGVILDYAESEADIEACRDEILTAGPFVDALRSDVPDETREQAKEAVLAHYQRLGDAVAPLLASPEPSFWGAARAVLTAEEAVALVETNFAFTAPLRSNRAAFRMETTIDVTDVLGGLARLLGPAPTVEIEYTDEALRAMTRAERVVIAETRREIDRRFG